MSTASPRSKYLIVPGASPPIGTAPVFESAIVPSIDWMPLARKSDTRILRFW